MSRCTRALGVGGCPVLALLALGWTPRPASAQDEEAPPPVGVSLPEATPEGRRTQTLSAGYRYNFSYPDHLDRENVADLAIMPMDLVNLGLQDDAGDPFYYRLPKWGAAVFVDMGVLFAAHEYGHISSISKSGYGTPVFGSKDGYATDQNGTNPWDLFVEGLRGGGGTAISVTNADWDHIADLFASRPDQLTRFMTAMKAGGLNEEEVVLGRYAQRLWEGDLSYLDTVPIVVSAIATLTYPVHMELSDIADYSALLKQQGLDASPSRIKLLSGLSLLSGTTVAAFRGALLGLATQDQTGVRPFSVGPLPGVEVEAPDLENYLSEFGPTLLAGVRTRIGTLELEPSYERLWSGGKSMGEYGLSASMLWMSVVQFGAAGFRNTTGGWWQEIGLNLLLVKWFSLGVGYSWASGYTFHRDIYGSNLDVLEARERDIKLIFALQYRF